MSEAQFDKVPPQSTEAEMAVLGAMLIEKEAILKVLDIVADDRFFYREAHRQVFKIIVGLYLENLPVDAISVTEELKNKKMLAGVGGAAYITNLINAVSTTANVEYYARIVREKAILRELIRAGTDIAEQGYKPNADPDKLLDSAEQAIFSLAQSQDRQGFARAKDLINPTLERIEAFLTRNVPGTPTGFGDIDEKTSGLQASNLIIVAGRPSMGKTSFCMNVVANIAVRDKVPVGIFSMETSKEDLMFRLICSEARVSAHAIRHGIKSKKTWPLITGCATSIYNAPIFIDDTPNLNVLELRTRTRKLASELSAEKKTLGLIVIDYIQMMRGLGDRENRQQEMAEISRSLKALARELEIPVIAISQLSRRPEEKGREGRRPQLSDLRESGALEQDADLVMFVYREFMYSREPEQEHQALIIISKQRNGPTGDVEMAWNGECTRFDQMEKRR
jgi:replicative DNA helicase